MKNSQIISAGFLFVVSVQQLHAQHSLNSTPVKVQQNIVAQKKNPVVVSDKFMADLSVLAITYSLRYEKHVQAQAILKDSKQYLSPVEYRQLERECQRPIKKSHSKSYMTKLSRLFTRKNK